MNHDLTINRPRRPSVGTGEFLHHLATNITNQHTPRDDGHCSAPECGTPWPCKPTHDALHIIEGCLTYWKRLDQQPTTPWPTRLTE